jgi:hypothetical protein
MAASCAQIAGAATVRRRSLGNRGISIAYCRGRQKMRQDSGSAQFRGHTFCGSVGDGQSKYVGVLISALLIARCEGASQIERAAVDDARGRSTQPLHVDRITPIYGKWCSRAPEQNRRISDSIKTALQAAFRLRTFGTWHSPKRPVRATACCRTRRRRYRLPPSPYSRRGGDIPLANRSERATVRRLGREAVIARAVYAE